MTVARLQPSAAQRRALRNLLSEGLHLFFPVAALHALLWLPLWTLPFALDLPLARAIPAGQWHAHEMIFGTYGAALAGFLTSAVPEWTDTPPRQGRDLLLLLGLWLPGRLIGVLGADDAIWLAGAADVAFLSLLAWFAAAPMITRRSLRHGSFVAWLCLLCVAEAGIRIAWMVGAHDLSGRLLAAAVLVFLVLLALALGRINVVVLNLALDPSGGATPYRPHPGRQNLAAALTTLYGLAGLLFPESQGPAFLALAAGSAFMDRLAEWFIGRSLLRGHVLALGAANLFAGLGLIAIGAAGLGAPIPPMTGVHLLSVGALGSAVLAVFVIAGLRHTGRPLALPWQAHAAITLIGLAALLRVLPEVGVLTQLAGMHHGLAALAWAGAFALWLARFLSFFLEPGVPPESACRDGP
ncbi:NnrS family protein [Chelatococcus sp. SYSU_G07232]|uniref:NnrS family protein n=1 Tax=Chelatococcus albus TaxID=3047466 RepID=A0ABT7ALK3_9HYPH|nr:NnrS family protein [Chelatococcus sp. SYSU_G07232]MDJ1160266.1 NnrS family protein [Chelatococcus sp. SYSU_G07232]